MSFMYYYLYIRSFGGEFTFLCVQPHNFYEKIKNKKMFYSWWTIISGEPTFKQAKDLKLRKEAAELDQDNILEASGRLYLFCRGETIYCLTVYHGTQASVRFTVRGGLETVR